MENFVSLWSSGNEGGRGQRTPLCKDLGGARDVVRVHFVHNFVVAILQ